MSSTMRSMGCDVAIATASVPVAACSTMKPPARRTLLVEYRDAGRSSTTSMRGELSAAMEMLRQMDRDPDREGRALAQLALDRDRAAEQLREAPAEREAEPRATDILLDRPAHLHEILEELRELLARDADAGVPDGERHRVRVAHRRGHAHLPRQG